MTDPLGLIGAAGAQRIDPARLSRAGGGAAPGKADPNAPSFKDYLLRNLHEVNQLQQDASRAVEDLVAGRRTDVETVLTATQQADLAFRMLLQVRNKVMSAYEELKQVRV